jgi:hypothetical protein
LSKFSVLKKFVTKAIRATPIIKKLTKTIAEKMQKYFKKKVPFFE